MSLKATDNQSIKDETIKFLSDQPLSVDRLKEIRFGHPGIANNLREVILQCPLPFTIGLFGRWGSGKTTIINLLRNKIQEDKVALAIFDVWKHEKDSLRKAFLVELVNNLKTASYFPKDFKLSQRITGSIQKVIRGSFESSKKGKNVLFIILGIILILAIVLAFVDLNIFWNYISIIFGGSLVTSLLLWFLTQTITRETLTSTLEPYKDPHEFEEEFEKIIRDVTSERLLIIIDNLDRCTHEKAVELLSTIKTFLAKDTAINNKKCLFLIACDDEAIKEHLKSIYLSNGAQDVNGKCFSADEFLRKFFNTHIRIPDFINTELESYTESLLKETSIPQFDSSDVAYIISKSFRENPRQIKQFINILISHYLLAKERESGLEPLIKPTGTITKNIPFLAKFLIIRQNFLKEFIEIKEQRLSIEEYEQIKNEALREFLKATKSITAQDIRPFIYFKQSEIELIIPGLDELELGLIDNKVDLVKERIGIIKEDPEKVKSFNRFLLELLERNKSRGTPLFNITSSLLESSKLLSFELTKTFYQKIIDFLNDEDALKSKLNSFDPPIIFNEILKRSSSKDRKSIISQYLNILNQETTDEQDTSVSEDYAYYLINELIEHKNWMDNNQKNILRDIITRRYYSSSKILSIFKDRLVDQKEFISEDAIQKFIKDISFEDIEDIDNFKEKTDLIINFKQCITPVSTEVLFDKLTEIFEIENKQPDRKEKENLLECVEDMFIDLEKQIGKIEEKSSIGNFSTKLIEGANVLGNWNQKKIFIFTGLILVDSLEDGQRANIISIIEQFFTHSDIDSIKFVFDKFSTEYKIDLINEYRNIFKNRIFREQPFFDFLYPIASKEIQNEWFLEMIKVNTQFALDKLEELDYKIENKKNVVRSFLEVVQDVNDHNKDDIYKALNILKCANDSELRQILGSRIKSLLTNRNIGFQLIGYNALRGAKHLSEKLRRDISRDIIEWLRNLQLPEAGQTHAIKSIFFNWEILQNPVKDYYIDFIFNKLLTRATNIENIPLGFDALFDVKPSFDKYSTYFEDLLERIKSEDNEQLRSELKTGLLKLKSQIKKGKKKFWDEVENL